MKGNPGILAIFSYLDQTIDAVKSLRQKGRQEFEVFSPVPHHELQDVLAEPRSPVRWFTLVGALTGTISGLALCMYTVADWPIYTGGKDLFSFPPFMIIAYELTILLGGLSTLAGLLVLCKLPLTVFNMGVYDERFGSDKYGVFVPCSTAERGEVRALLTTAGAEEVNDATA